MPMKRLIEATVFSLLSTAWRRASCPTRRSPVLVKATTLDVSRPPSELGITTGSPPSRTAITELVVPRSMPTTFGMSVAPLVIDLCLRLRLCALGLVRPRRLGRRRRLGGDDLRRGRLRHLDRHRQRDR